MAKTTDWVILLVFSAIFSRAFTQDLPFLSENYSFINEQKNHFEFRGNSQDYYKELFRKFNRLILKGEGQIHVYHFGDSHIQADFFPGEMRKRLQEFFQNTVSGRGFIFPYSVAQTNSPPDYKSYSNTVWERCKNISVGPGCSLGIAGISIKTYQNPADLTISFNYQDELMLSFNKIRIFYNIHELTANFSLKNYEGHLTQNHKPIEGFTEIIFDRYLTRIDLIIENADTTGKPFILYGISFENNDPGITYSSVGVNGADTRAFLKCNRLQEELKAIAPDWIIISLGTNDAYAKAFDERLFYCYYDSLLAKIRQVFPFIPILLTTPGDSYRGNKYLNPNNEKACNIIFQLAEKHHAAIWDFYTIMGGSGAIDLWYKAGLTNQDRLHLNRQGYILQGDLLFEAFVRAYDFFLDNNQIK